MKLTIKYYIHNYNKIFSHYNASYIYTEKYNIYINDKSIYIIMHNQPAAIRALARVHLNKYICIKFIKYTTVVVRSKDCLLTAKMFVTIDQYFCRIFFKTCFIRCK